MTAGLPDYHSPIDVALQTLAEVTARNKYGAPQRTAYSQPSIPAGSTVDLLSITGTGFIYGGNFNVAPSPNITDSEGLLTMVIDGTSYPFPKWSDIIKFNFIERAPFMLSLTMIGGPDNEYAGYLPGNITFETSFVLKYTADASGTEGAVGAILFATI